MILPAQRAGKVSLMQEVGRNYLDVVAKPGCRKLANSGIDPSLRRCADL